MKLKITQPGVVGIAKGEIVEIDGDKIPAWLVGKAERADEIKVDEPKDEHPVIRAEHRGGGKYSLFNGDDIVASGLSKDDAKAINAMSEEDRAEYVASLDGPDE